MLIDHLSLGLVSPRRDAYSKRCGKATWRQIVDAHAFLSCRPALPQVFALEEDTERKWNEFFQPEVIDR